MAEQEIEAGATVDTEGAKEAESPAAGADVKDTSPSGGADTGGAQAPVQERLPFHEDPQVQSYLQKMMSRKEKEWERRFQERDTEYTRRLEAMTKPTAPGAALSEEEQAVQMLRQKLGLDKLDERLGEVSKSHSQFTQSQLDTMADAELSSVVESLSKQYGYKPAELQEEILNFVADHPLGSRDYKKGSIEAMGKLWAYDKQAELAERAANLKLIKEQQDKKKVATESPNGAKKSPGKRANESMDDFLARREREEGGLSFD